MTRGGDADEGHGRPQVFRHDVERRDGSPRPAPLTLCFRSPRNAMTDFFISYTRADRDWAVWIAWVLEEKGYTTIIQDWDFRPGGNFVLDMQKATAGAERTVAVLSPDYIESPFGAPEWAAALAKDPTGEKGILLPVRVREVELAGLLPQVVYVDLVGLDQDTSRVRLLAGVKRERAKPARPPAFPVSPPPPFPGSYKENPTPALPLDRIPDPGPLPAGSRMPFSHNPLFVGRQEDLRTLARQLKAGETSAVGPVEIAAATGLGGIGKTQLAAEFVHRYGRSFDGGVFWMSFADPAAVPAEVAACGTSLDLHPSYDDLPLDQQVRLVEEVWMRAIPRLLVFDNCEEESLLDRWRPRTGGARVLLTSRRQRWDRSLGVESVQISTLPRPAGDRSGVGRPRRRVGRSPPGAPPGRKLPGTLRRSARRPAGRLSGSPPARRPPPAPLTPRKIRRALPDEPRSPRRPHLRAEPRKAASGRRDRRPRSRAPRPSGLVRSGGANPPGSPPQYRGFRDGCSPPGGRRSGPADGPRAPRSQQSWRAGDAPAGGGIRARL